MDARIAQFTKSVQEQIIAIAEERRLGASVIARMSAQCFLTFAEEEGHLSAQQFWDALYHLAKELIWAQPDMAPPFSLANQILFAVKTAFKQGANTETLQGLVREEAMKALQLAKLAQERIAMLGVELVDRGETILTHSHSSSVKNILEKTHKSGKSFHVIVTESRPGLEGKMLAEQLGRMGIATTLITEAAALGMLARCTKVFVGADRISEKHFVNKVGTRALALGAKEKGCAFFVVCDTSKFVPGRFGTFMRKQHPPEEVLEQHFPNVIVENPYFEVVPLSLVTAIVCEEGLLPPAGVAEYLQENVHFPELLDPAQ